MNKKQKINQCLPIDDINFYEEKELSSGDQTNFDADSEEDHAIFYKDSLPQQRLQKTEGTVIESINELDNSIPFQSIQFYEPYRFPFRYFSVSKQYEVAIKEKLFSQTQGNSYQNRCIKIFYANVKTKLANVQFFQKLIKKTTKSRKIKLKMKQKKQFLDVPFDKLLKSETEIYICKCTKSFQNYKIFVLHMKSFFHETFLQLNTKKQRKIQQKLYLQIQMNTTIQQFDSNFLYKSFQSIFLQGNLHYAIIQKDDIQTSCQQIPLLQDRKFYQQRQSTSTYFSKLQMQIYKKLHEFHKGNEIICHKCLTKEEHIALFLLGYQYVLKRNLNFTDLLQQRNYKVVLNQIEEHLLQFIKFPQQNFKRSVKKEQIKCHGFRKHVQDILVNFLQCFQYIDMEDLFEN